MDTALMRSFNHAMKRVLLLTSLSALSLSPRAGVQIQDDPMRPATASVATPVPANKASADSVSLPNAAGQLSLKVTRANRANPAVFVALVDDTWVKRGDLVAGHRVVAVHAESIDLVSVANPLQRMTLRMNPITVQRVNTTAVASTPASTPASAALPRRRALEK
jgi:hypothetical protein